jgi:hypothetical protein
MNHNMVQSPTFGNKIHERRYSIRYTTHTFTPSSAANFSRVSPKASVPMAPKYEVESGTPSIHCATRMEFCVAPPEVIRCGVMCVRCYVMCYVL